MINFPLKIWECYIFKESNRGFSILNRFFGDALYYSGIIGAHGIDTNDVYIYIHLDT